MCLSYVFVGPVNDKQNLKINLKLFTNKYEESTKFKNGFLINTNFHVVPILFFTLDQNTLPKYNF
jgi:hypothetical protein